MRNPERIDKVLAALGEVWHKYPDLRLGQLIMNVYGDPYFVEDNELISGLIAYYTRSAQMNRCKRCIFAIWDNDIIIGCQRDDCTDGVVQYDD